MIARCKALNKVGRLGTRWSVASLLLLTQSLHVRVYWWRYAVAEGGDDGVNDDDALATEEAYES